MDVVAITAHVGDCEAVCLVLIEELRHGTSIEAALTTTEMKQSSTKVKVRLAQVDITVDSVRLNGRCQAVPFLLIDGADIEPLTHSAEDSSGIMFDLGELKTLAGYKKAGSSGPLRFEGVPQHEALVLEGSRGIVEAAAAKLIHMCCLCPCSCPTVSMRQHAGGHILHGLTMIGRDTKSLCGVCCGVLADGRCSTTVSKLAKAATSKFVSNCAMFPGDQVTCLHLCIV